LRDEVQITAYRVAGTILIVAAIVVPLVLGISADRPSSSRE
jgi:hypothetical protein